MFINAAVKGSVFCFLNNLKFKIFIKLYKLLICVKIKMYIYKN